MSNGRLLLEVGTASVLRRSFFTCRQRRGFGPWFLAGSDGRSGKAEGRLCEQASALLRIEHAHDAVLAVIASLPSHLAGTHAAHSLGQQGRPLAVEVLKWRILQHAQLGPDPCHQFLAGAAHALAARSHAQHFAHNFGQRHQAGKRLGPLGPKARGPVSQRRHPAQHAAGERLSTARTGLAAGRRLFRRHHHFALAVAVGVVLALFGEKLERAKPAGPTLAERVAHRKVGEIAVEQVGFAPQFFRRMGIGAGDECVAIQGGEAPVHGRVRRETGFDCEDVMREISEAVFDRIEA